MFFFDHNQQPRNNVASLLMNCKTCTHCKTGKPLSEFHRQSAAKDGHASWCKTCANGIYRERRKRSYKPEDKRRWQLKTRYNLTTDQVEEMLKRQGGVCALCPAELKKFHIDHCHNSSRVRGLLCHRCNIRLGGWDDIAWREKAIQYLGLNNNPASSEAA